MLFSARLWAQADKTIVYPSQVRQFYSFFQNKTVWVQNEKALHRLLLYLDSADYLGLQEKDYHFGFIKSFRLRKTPVLTAEDSLMADYRFSDAAIHFFRDVMVGNSAPVIGYNGLNYSPDWSVLPSLLASALLSGQFENLLYRIEPKSSEYIALKNKISQYNSILNDTTYKREQADGVASTLLVKELNVPLPERIAALNRAINTVRWLNGLRKVNDHIIVVNIPSAHLLVFDREKITMESKVIVGKSSNRTPTLCSKIEDVVLYPYWMVPKKIATKELLPLIKKNTGYLDANGFQVVNERGKLVDPYSVDWHSLSTDYFPYVLRQSTGCDNSLGIVKLNFYNPYTVYLHDTPWKSLFNFNRRFFSHGCMRVEKAIELAKLIVKEKSGLIDSLASKGCLPDQEPIIITAREKMPVFVLYNTAWIDSTATVRFYEDVYGKFPIRRL
jgi:L,D-transpeptidase YcbB